MSDGERASDDGTRGTAIIWLREAGVLALWLAPCALAGVLLGYPGWGFAIGAAAYLGRHLYYLYRAVRWLEHRKHRTLPRGHGLWAEVLAGFERLDRRNRRRKKRLQKVAARFEEATEASPDATVILREDGEVLWANSAARRLLGVGRGRVGTLGDPRLDRYVAAHSYEDPLEIVAPADPDRTLLVRIVPYGEDRRLLQARDVTRLHRLEQVRRDFVGNVSHELRSPLTVIVGYLEAMSDEPGLARDWGRPLELMSQQAARMTRIVEDLLRLSRLESDPGGAPHDPVDLSELTATVAGDARGVSAGRHRVEVQAEPGIVVFGEFNELYSAFANLAFNAVQYTPEGGTVKLRCRRDGDEAELAVEDDGPGIEAEHLPRLTERFYRIDKARSREIGGTGLGLAIVKHVLMRHEATLSIESELGHGSRFTCRFPRIRVAAGAARPAAAAG